MQTVSKLTKEQEAQQLDLVSYAFSWELSEKNQRRFGWLNDHSVSYGSFAKEYLTSQVMVTPFTVNLFDTLYPMSGIGFVASYPEYRGQGRIDELMTQIIADCQAEGTVLSYLAPFSYPFYRRYGYELVFERIKYQVGIQEWPDAKKVPGQIKRVSYQAAKAVIKTIYPQLAKNHQGGVVREDWWLDYKFCMRKDYTYAIYQDELGVPQGYLIYLINDGKLLVQEMNYLHHTAYKALNRFIASHNGSVSEVIYEEGYTGENLQFHLATPFAQFFVRPEMMVRVVDVLAFLERFPFEKIAQAFGIKIRPDKYAPWNEGVYEVSHEQGEPSIKKVTTSRLPLVEMDVQQFVQLFFGYKKATELAFHEKIVGDETALVTLNEVIPQTNRKPTLEDYF
ncbi:MAG: enhanced intracellular survival protein Eis [Enterococcus sp.]